jgi:hypothetical protein
MAETKDSAQKRRAEARAKRRSASGHDDGDSRDEAVAALRGAAAAALAGAAAGATRAYIHRKGDGERDEDPADDDDDVTDDEPEARADDDDDEFEPAPAPAPAQEPDPEPEPLAGVDASALVGSARDHLRLLRGVDSESVSSVSRTANGWRIGLEVVEVRRIPESTDVLATYEVELDSSGELLSFERTRRYARTEVDRR